MHWQKLTTNPFFLLCLSKAGTGFSYFFLAEISISPTFSLIWGTETNKNQLKAWRGEEDRPTGADNVTQGHSPSWVSGTPQAPADTVLGRLRQRWFTHWAGGRALQPGVRSLSATISMLVVLPLGDLPFPVVVSQNTLICHIALDKIFIGIILHSKTGRESNYPFYSAAW